MSSHWPTSHSMELADPSLPCLVEQHLSTMSRYRMSFLIGAFEGMLYFDYQLHHRLSHLGIVRGAGSHNLATCSASPLSEGKHMVRHSTSAAPLCTKPGTSIRSRGRLRVGCSCPSQRGSLAWRVREGLQFPPSQGLHRRRRHALEVSHSRAPFLEELGYHGECRTLLYWCTRPSRRSGTCSRVRDSC